MEQERKNKTKAIMVIALAVCLVSITVTAAYFIVSATTRNQELTVTTGTMALTFSDNSDGINESLMFGESVTKDFKIENTGTLPAVAKISFDDLVNTYIAESLTYTLSYATSETGTYTTVKSANVPRSETASKVELAGNLTIPAGETYYYRLTIKLEYLEDIDQTEDLNASFSTRFTIDEDRVGEDTYTVNVSGLTLEVNKHRPDFGTIATTNEGVFAMEDNYGTSYYFRGAVENNYVKFGKWADDTPDMYYGYSSNKQYPQSYNSLEECQNASSFNQNCTLISRAGKDMYWRIIRVNGDGSVRMIYDGTTAHPNGYPDADRQATLLKESWNLDNRNDVKYMGYMYGGVNGEASTSKEQAQTNETSSNAKTKLEEWYKTNIEDAGYGKYIADVIFCNDRSTAETPDTWRPIDTTLGYGTNVTSYGIFERLYALPDVSILRRNPEPTFICPTNNAVETNNDWFTAEATVENKGNGALDYPVGLITLDEVVSAGGTGHNTKGGSGNVNYYLYKGLYYWTLTPGHLHTDGYAYHFTMINTGAFLNTTVTNTVALVPVINLTPEYAKTMLGTGTLQDPYRAAE